MAIRLIVLASVTAGAMLFQAIADRDVAFAFAPTPVHADTARSRRGCRRRAPPALPAHGIRLAACIAGIRAALRSSSRATLRRCLPRYRVPPAEAGPRPR